jgi:peptide/nickel transport system substrate-binding protein
VKPGLAESWTNSPDGKTWTFKLRKNLRWSDGEPLTADDVMFTMERCHLQSENSQRHKRRFSLMGKNFTVTKVTI